jgi:hypothetical protein
MPRTVFPASDTRGKLRAHPSVSLLKLSKVTKPVDLSRLSVVHNALLKQACVILLSYV